MSPKMKLISGLIAGLTITGCAGNSSPLPPPLHLDEYKFDGRTADKRWIANGISLSVPEMRTEDEGIRALIENCILGRGANGKGCEPAVKATRLKYGLYKGVSCITNPFIPDCGKLDNFMDHQVDAIKFRWLYCNDGRSDEICPTPFESQFEGYYRYEIRCSVWEFPENHGACKANIIHGFERDNIETGGIFMGKLKIRYFNKDSNSIFDINERTKLMVDYDNRTIKNVPYPNVQPCYNYCVTIDAHFNKDSRNMHGRVEFHNAMINVSMEQNLTGYITQTEIVGVINAFDNRYAGGFIATRVQE